MARRNGSRDHNHQEIVARFEALGCSVGDLALAGVEGWPDIVVGLVGYNFLVEIKNPSTSYGRKGLNAEQSNFAGGWRGGRVYVVRTVFEVDVLVENLRRHLCKLPPMP